MVFERKRYQFGYVRQKERKTGSHVWVWEYRDSSGSHSVILGTVEGDPRGELAPSSPLICQPSPHRFVLSPKIVS